MLDRQNTVARTVLDHSECAAVFVRNRIDYCCQGDVSIDDACKRKGLDPQALLGELERAIAERQETDAPDRREMPTGELVGHIVSTHHDYLRKTMPFLQGLASKVSRVHGDHNPKLRELEAIVHELFGALSPHLDVEEGTLFPALLSPQPDRSVISRELAEMFAEHREVGQLLERMRGATEDYSVPDWGCNSYRTLFKELERLEDDVLRHVHLENHVLMPRFVAA